MTEEATRLPVAEIVNVEAVFSRELIAEVAAVTEMLASRKDELRVLMGRAVAVAKAFNEATRRIVDLDGTTGAPDGLYELLSKMSGMDALDALAAEVGLSEAILEGPGPQDLTDRSGS